MLINSDPAIATTTDATDETVDVATRLPKGFELRKDGIYVSDESKPDEPAKRICSPFVFIAKTRDADSGSWGLLIGWEDDDGKPHEWAMPRSLLAGDGTDYRRELLSGGAYLAPGKVARDRLATLLQIVSPKSRARAVSRIGWHGDSYVLPDMTFGDSTERVLLQTEMRVGDGFKVAGDLDSWRVAVAQYAAGNSRLVFALCTAFAAPLLHLSGSESGGVHFTGPSSIGKTTAAAMAASVWGGGPNGYIKQWRATANGLEGVAAGHNDCLLVLDEISQIDGHEAGSVAYMLANGSGKTRANRAGAARAAQQWRLLFLSTGEISLADKVADDGRGRRAMAGQKVRVLDIPADAGAGMGMFEHLHGFPSADALARLLKAAAHQHYGTAGRALLQAVTEQPEVFGKAVATMRDEFVAEHCKAGADGQVSRATARFGLIAAAGEIAIKLGILPLEADTAKKAASTCLDAWLALRGTQGPSDVLEAIAQAKQFLELHGDARFVRYGGPEEDKRTIINRAGARHVEADESSSFYILPGTWQREILKGHDMRAVNKAMVEAGLLEADSKGKASIRARLPNIGLTRCYHVLPKIFEDVADGSGA